MKALPNWPEFPEGKFWASLRKVDPKDKRGFEEWMIDLRRQQEQYPACVQAYHVTRYACVRLLWAKQNALSIIPASYKHFARIARGELGVISFNWDLVCERALDAELVPWAYSSRTTLIPVIKPHGSLNWTNHLMQEDWGRVIKNPVDFNAIAPDSSISWMPDRPFDDPLLKYDSDDLRCLLFPGNDELLERDPGARARAEKERLWREAISLIGRADCIAFIGYSLPGYDVEARQVLEYACRRKVVVVCNPAGEVIEEFKRVFRHSHIVPEPYKFEESRFGSVRRVRTSA